MSSYELCVNLWFCYDKQTGFINAVAGRGYYLQGSDQQKLDILETLSGADFLCVEWQPLPRRYRSVFHKDCDSQKPFCGAVHISHVDIHGLALFEEVFRAIEGIHQPFAPIQNMARLKAPDRPLYVMTAVEDDNGRVRV